MPRAEAMETYAARLASFDVVYPATKRRTSHAKGAKTLTWPHSSPSPAELAQAGFYYKPSSSSPDNATCFMCERGLDGWEEDDDPIVEHLRHSPDCAWAIIVNIGHGGLDPSQLADPMGSSMMQARKATFAPGWPHDGKRGWTCKSDKVVAAGWHYTPTPESDDFVTCAYCKMGLDGWEPKDSPYDEHYRRCPDCVFFVLASKTTKTTKGRKGRPSKASRLSTQSNLTVVSEAPSIPELDLSIDGSLLSVGSVMSTVSTTAGNGKKGAKGKGRSTRTKKVEPVDVEAVLEVIDDADTHESDGRLPKPMRGKKRTSDLISEDSQDRKDRESTVKPEPPPKRRATRTRNSVAQQSEEVASQPQVLELEVQIPKPSRAVGRPRASSRSRKISTASTASKASLRSAIPDDSAIDAALEADLDKPLSDDEEMQQEPPADASLVHSTAASTAPVRTTKNADHVQPGGSADQQAILEASADTNLDSSVVAYETQAEAPKKGKASKSKGKRKAAAKKATQSARASDTSVAANTTLDTDLNSSIMTSRTLEDDSGHESEASATTKAAVRKGGRKKSTTSKKGKGSKSSKTGMMSKNIEDIVQQPQGIEEMVAITDSKSIEISTEEPFDQDAPPAKKASEPNAAIKARGKQKAATEQPALENPDSSQDNLNKGADNNIPTAVVNPQSSPSPPTKEATPSPSPQPSDAENQPPSSLPSQTRPPLLSLSPPKTQSQSQTVHVPLATSTPTTSPSKRNIQQQNHGFLSTAHPWTTVDLETIFSTITPGADKENFGLQKAVAVGGDITSPEKKMKVEDWIFWNAKGAEEKLRGECERVVGVFEMQGGRAMRTLEGLDCVE